MNTVSSFIVQIAHTQHVGVKLYYWCQNAVHKAVINFSLNLFGLAFTTVLWYCTNQNNKWSILCCKRCVLHLIMYTVNNSNFFDYGVNTGDAQLDVRTENRRQLLLSTPIQFFGTPQSKLFVSHAPMHTFTYTQGHGCYIYYEYIFWYCPILFCTILNILCKIFSKVQEAIWI